MRRRASKSVEAIAASRPVESWRGPEDLPDALLGRWALERAIRGYGSMTGTASFSAMRDGLLLYQEAGSFRLASGALLEFARDYLYAKRPHGFAVLFRESPPRLFHAVRLEQLAGKRLVGRAEHGCGDDLYRSKYSFVADGRFFVEHVVAGPCKDYTIEAAFTRL